MSDLLLWLEWAPVARLLRLDSLSRILEEVQRLVLVLSRCLPLHFQEPVAIIHVILQKMRLDRRREVVVFRPPLLVLRSMGGQTRKIGTITEIKRFQVDMEA